MEREFLRFVQLVNVALPLPLAVFGHSYITITTLLDSNATHHLKPVDHSLNPKSMLDHRALYDTLMFGPSPLRRYQREMIGVVVSALNECHY